MLYANLYIEENLQTDEAAHSTQMKKVIYIIIMVMVHIYVSRERFMIFPKRSGKTSELESKYQFISQKTHSTDSLSIAILRQQTRPLLPDFYFPGYEKFTNEDNLVMTSNPHRTSIATLSVPHFFI